MSISNVFLMFPVISFLIYCPVLCYLDWMYHDIKTHDIWVPLVVMNLPVLIAGYIFGLYPPALVLISTFGVCLWFAAMWTGFLPGGDFVWLSLISIFVVLNPFTGLPFMLTFSFYIIGMTAAAIFGIVLDKRLHRQKIDLHTVLDFPYMIPICAALVAAVFL